MTAFRFVEIVCDGEGCDASLAAGTTVREARAFAREQGCSRERTPAGTYIDLCSDCTEARRQERDR